MRAGDCKLNPKTNSSNPQVPPGARLIRLFTPLLPTRPILARLSLVALSCIVALMAVACSDDPDIIAVRGRSIEIHAERPVVVEKVAYSFGGEHREIRPRASNRQLALVEVTVVNRTSTTMPLLVNPEAARIGDRRGERIEARNPFEDYKVVDHASEDEDAYAPLLWGDIELNREFQVQGWMIFDVPKNLTLGSFWWHEIDEVVGDYVEYRRR